MLVKRTDFAGSLAQAAEVGAMRPCARVKENVFGFAMIGKGGCGTPGPIRTADLLLRRQTLYPAELRAHTTLPDNCVTPQRRGQTISIAHHCATISLRDHFHFPERWLSGRKQRFAKPSYGQKLYRGFESLPLRQFPHSILQGENHFFNCVVAQAAPLSAWQPVQPSGIFSRAPSEGAMKRNVWARTLTFAIVC